MFLVDGKKMVAKFICSGCGEPIDNLHEVNFAPVRADSNYGELIEQHNGDEMHPDALEIWHWACDDAGYPWKNAADAFAHYFERERSRARASRSR